MVIFRSKVEERGQRDRAQSAFKNASVFDYRALYLRCRERLAYQLNTNVNNSTRRLQSCETARQKSAKGNLLSAERKLLAPKGNLSVISDITRPWCRMMSDTVGWCRMMSEDVGWCRMKCASSIDFGVLFDAIALCVAIFSWSNFGDCQQLLDHRFLRAFWCNYIRRDEFSYFNVCSKFKEK